MIFVMQNRTCAVVIAYGVSFKKQLKIVCRLEEKAKELNVKFTNTA